MSDDILNQCPNCKTITGLPDWKARYTYLWANQYGQCIRIFCKQCGQWTDRTWIYSTDKVTSEVIQVPKDWQHDIGHYDESDRFDLVE